MPKDHEFEDEYQTRESHQDSFESDSFEEPKRASYQAPNNRQAKDSKKGRPWSQRFSADENLKNRQFSRTARNQPDKEATTLSKVLLAVFVVLLIIPLAIFMIVDAQRNNDDIPGRKAEQVMISRTSTSQESSSASSQSSSSQSSASQSISSRAITVENDDESSSESTGVTEEVTQPETPAVEPETPEPTPSGSGSYTIQQGDTWYGVARNYGIDVYTLLEMNGATTSTPIHPGMTIVVP